MRVIANRLQTLQTIKRWSMLLNENIHLPWNFLGTEWLNELIISIYSIQIDRWSDSVLTFIIGIFQFMEKRNFFNRCPFSGSTPFCSFVTIVFFYECCIRESNVCRNIYFSFWLRHYVYILVNKWSCFV